VSVNDWDMWLRVCIDTRVLYDPTPSCLMRRHGEQIIADKGKMDASWVALLEENLVRLETLAPQHLPLAREKLAAHRLRRARRAFREDRVDDAEQEIRRALELAPGPGRRLEALRLRFESRLRRTLRGRR
jgi:hypothetical protein